VELLDSHGLQGQVVSILRQELDSLIRVIYLLSTDDLDYQMRLMQASVDGRAWTHRGKHSRITDREMVNFADELHGWVQLLYKAGCAFIHLSRSHDYLTRDPMATLSSEEKADLQRYLDENHGFIGENPRTFEELTQFFPAVFRKIANMLEWYTQDLEKGRGLLQRSKEDSWNPPEP
jgi:hypothetical protein